MLKTLLEIASRGLQAWNEFWERRKVQDAKDTGAMEQREQNRADSDKALADDRVRDSNAALQQRVRDDHGIETGTAP